MMMDRAEQLYTFQLSKLTSSTRIWVYRQGYIPCRVLCISFFLSTLRGWVTVIFNQQYGEA